MKVSEFKALVEGNMSETKAALELLWSNINQGQRKQIIKNEEIKAIFDRYHVDYE